jgi:hypothetical protein
MGDTVTLVCESSRLGVASASRVQECDSEVARLCDGLPQTYWTSLFQGIIPVPRTQVVSSFEGRDTSSMASQVDAVDLQFACREVSRLRLSVESGPGGVASAGGDDSSFVGGAGTVFVGACAGRDCRRQCVPPLFGPPLDLKASSQGSHRAHHQCTLSSTTISTSRSRVTEK